MIRSAPLRAGAPQRWMDLGAGAGTFTLALARLLPAGSSICAVDRDPEALRALPSSHGGVRVRTQVADVLDLELEAVDGVLMANVLHFIAAPAPFLASLAKHAPLVLLVEYERTVPLAPWVPYPVPMQRAVGLFRDAGFTRSEQLGSRPSRFGGGPLYAAAFHADHA